MAIRPPETASLTVAIDRWVGGISESVADEVVTEEPLEIRVRGDSGAEYSTLAITMRTPGNDIELALGFLYGEGLLLRPSQVLDARMSLNSPNVVEITLDTIEDLARLAEGRRFYTTSSCGLCGRSSLDAVSRALRGRTVLGDVLFSAPMLTRLPALLRARQSVFETTGGLHGCGLFDQEGRLLASREDVGRHNAVDKLLGRGFQDGELPATNRILVLSGRAGFELIQKSVMAGVSVVAAVGAPTSLAIELARQAGQTLIGFLSSQRMNIYAGSERINGS